MARKKKTDDIPMALEGASFDSEQFSKALAFVGKAVAGRSSLPVLDNVLIQVESLAEGKYQLRLAATDLEVAICALLPCVSDRELKITVPKKPLDEWAKTLDLPINLSITDRTQTANFQSGSSRLNLKGLDAGEFPLISTPPVEGLDLEATQLSQALTLVKFAMATDDARPLLKAVFWHIEGDVLKLVASDGFRLAKKEVTLTGYTGGEVRAIVPARAILELANLVKSAEEGDPVRVSITPDKAYFQIGRYVLVAQLLEGAFPEYSNIIPKKSATKVRMATSELLKACKRITITAADFTGRFKIEPGTETEPGTLTVLGQNADIGSGEELLDISVDGEPIEIAFNVKYVKDVAEAVDAPNIELGVNAPASPGVLRLPGDPSYLCVVMPMHIGK